MSTCSKCGRRGLFLKLDSDGVCKQCLTKDETIKNTERQSFINNQQDNIDAMPVIEPNVNTPTKNEASASEMNKEELPEEAWSLILKARLENAAACRVIYKSEYPIDPQLMLVSSIFARECLEYWENNYSGNSNASFEKLIVKEAIGAGICIFHWWLLDKEFVLCGQALDGLKYGDLFSQGISIMTTNRPDTEKMNDSICNSVIGFLEFCSEAFEELFKDIGGLEKFTKKSIHLGLAYHFQLGCAMALWHHNSNFPFYAHIKKAPESFVVGMKAPGEYGYDLLETLIKAAMGAGLVSEKYLVKSPLSEYDKVCTWNSLTYWSYTGKSKWINSSLMRTAAFDVFGMGAFTAKTMLKETTTQQLMLNALKERLTAGSGMVLFDEIFGTDYCYQKLREDAINMFLASLEEYGGEIISSQYVLEGMCAIQELGFIVETNQIMKNRN